MSRRASQPHRYPSSFCTSTGEMTGVTGPQISPKSDQNAKRSTFQKPSTELVLSKSVDNCRQEPIRDLWELESHLQSATPAETHHNATIYEKDNSVFGQELPFQYSFFFQLFILIDAGSKNNLRSRTMFYSVPFSVFLKKNMFCFFFKT